MTPLLIFNATVLVFWSGNFLPNALKNDDKLSVWMSLVVMLILEIWLCLNWAEREYPVNLIAAVCITLFGFMGGRVMFLINQKMEKQDS